MLMIGKILIKKLSNMIHSEKIERSQLLSLYLLMQEQAYFFETALKLLKKYLKIL